MKTDFNIMKLIASTLMLGVAFPSWAHTGLGNISGFSAGFAHPSLGVDHVLMAFVVGFWSCYATAKPMRYLPFCFLASMAVGMVLAYLEIDIPEVGQGITMPLWVIGLCLGLNKLPVPLWTVPLLAISGVSHGYTHAIEVTSQVDYFHYLIGVFSATLVLHAIGMTVGRMGMQVFPSLRQITALTCIAVSALAISG
jgi:urease accessory protein